ncbi:hypothetical protein [Tateyamaria sp. syn59]|uniref:hypothetical protein n=1 Tax=Tateyamaria sp. syn59 TaxID=2576942 RepID=UPI0011BF0AA0|nr:hypothetical protein [Tateyamaria sp. syn59]
MPAKTPPAIYCFSKGGHSRHAAWNLAKHTGAEVMAVDVTRYRVPMFWIIRAIWDAGRKNAPPLKTGNILPAARPWIVVAGPVWADLPAAPMRSVLKELAQSDIPVGVLLTCGRKKEQQSSITACEAVLRRPLAGSVTIPNHIENTEEMETRLGAFASAMSNQAAQGAA